MMSTVLTSRYSASSFTDRVGGSSTFPSAATGLLSAAWPAPGVNWVRTDASWSAVSTAMACRGACRCGRRKSRMSRASTRSEEHTSELQSQSNLVCRLLLEKKQHHQLPLPVKHELQIDVRGLPGIHRTQAPACRSGKSKRLHQPTLTSPSLPHAGGVPIPRT